MKLLFDARWIKPNSPDGLTRYSQELIAALAHEEDVELTLLVSDKTQAKGVTAAKDVLVFPKPTSPLELVTAIRLRKHRFDAIYSPHFVFGGLGKNAPLVLTVHDLIPLHYPSKSASLLWRTFYSSPNWIKLLLMSSTGVATVSKTVASQLTQFVKKPIAVVYNAPTKFKRAKFKETKKQLLYMGRYEKYKNIELLISAMKELPDYELLLAGSVTNDRKAELMKKAPQNVEFLGRISDDEYTQLLADSFALVSASLEEGFGLPIVEAMANGLPVVISATEIFREVGSDAALYFEPTSASEFCAQVRKLEVTKIRDEKISEGHKRAADFSWESSARKLVEFIESLKNN